MRRFTTEQTPTDPLFPPRSALADFGELCAMAVNSAESWDLHQGLLWRASSSLSFPFSSSNRESSAWNASAVLYKVPKNSSPQTCRKTTLGAWKELLILYLFHVPWRGNFATHKKFSLSTCKIMAKFWKHKSQSFSSYLVNTKAAGHVAASSFLEITAWTIASVVIVWWNTKNIDSTENKKKKRNAKHLPTAVAD